MEQSRCFCTTVVDSAKCQNLCYDAQGVQHLHSVGRSHTDLKMENILVSNVEDYAKMQVTIIDVGGSMVQGTCTFLSQHHTALGIAQHCSHLPFASFFWSVLRACVAPASPLFSPGPCCLMQLTSFS